MQLLINIDHIKDVSKREWLIDTLKMLNINFETLKPQSIEEYNKEIEEAEKEIENGNFITAEDLKIQAKSW